MSKKQNQQKTESKNKRKAAQTAKPRFSFSELKTPLIMIAVIIAAGLLLYGKTYKYDLVFCDDNIFVIDYYGFNANPDNAKECFSKTMGTTYYRPMLNLSILYDTQLTLSSQYKDKTPQQVEPQTIKPTVFHITNIIFHLLASVMVFLFLLRLGYPRIVSFIAGLFMVVHPILTPAVSWISGRNDSMETVFILLALIFFLQFYGNKKAGGVLYYLLHMAVFSVALYTKEVSAFLPFVCMAYIYFIKKPKNLFNQQNIALIAGWFVVGMIWYFMRAEAIKGINNPDTLGLDALKDNYLSVFALLGKIFLPAKMIALSSYEMFSIASGIVALLGLAGFIFLKSKIDKPSALFGIFWFVLFLFPTLLVRIIYVGDFFDYAEHRAYLVMVGVIIVLIEILRSFEIDFSSKKFIIPAAVLLLALGAKSWSYTPAFENRTSFWQKMVDMYPYKSRGYLDLGKAYFVKDSLAKAEELYKKGIERNPNNKNLYIDLSALELRRNNFSKSIEWAHKALAIDSLDNIAHYNIGKSAYNMNDLPLAVSSFEKANRNNNKYPVWIVDLGIAYYRTNQMEKAIEAYQRCLQLDPNNYFAYSNMGSAYASRGNLGEAVRCWETALSINPQMYDSYNNLMRYYFIANNPQEVRRYYALMIQNGGGDKLPPDVIAGLQRFGIK